VGAAGAVRGASTRTARSAAASRWRRSSAPTTSLGGLEVPREQPVLAPEDDGLHLPIDHGVVDREAPVVEVALNEHQVDGLHPSQRADESGTVGASACRSTETSGFLGAVVDHVHYVNGRASVVQTAGDRWFYVCFDGARTGQYYSDLEHAQYEADALEHNPQLVVDRAEWARVRSLPKVRALVKTASGDKPSAFLWSYGNWDSTREQLHVTRFSPYAWRTEAIARRSSAPMFTSFETLPAVLSPTAVLTKYSWATPFQLRRQPRDSVPAIVDATSLNHTDGREGELWGALIALVRDLCPFDRHTKFKVGITNDPESRAKSYRRTYDTMFLLGASKSRTRIAATEAALILGARADEVLSKRIQNELPGGETVSDAAGKEGLDLTHFVYVCTLGETGISWDLSDVTFSCPA
jgi:hypothetical protein